MDNDLQRASMRCGSTSGRLAIGMLLIIAGTMEPVRAAVSDDRPLLGGSLTWAINRDFKTGREGLNHSVSRLTCVLPRSAISPFAENHLRTQTDI